MPGGVAGLVLAGGAGRRWGATSGGAAGEAGAGVGRGGVVRDGADHDDDAGAGAARGGDAGGGAAGEGAAGVMAADAGVVRDRADRTGDAGDGAGGAGAVRDGADRTGDAGDGAPKMLVTDGSGTTLLAHAVRTLADGGCAPIVVVVGAHEEAVRAELDRVAVQVDVDLHVVTCPTWHRGMGESLRTGLRALADAAHPPATAAPSTTRGRTGELSTPETGVGLPPLPESDAASRVPSRLWAEQVGARTQVGHAADPADGAEPPEAVVVTLADLPDQNAALVRRLVEGDPRGSRALARLTYAGRPGHPVLIGRDHSAAAADAAHDDVGARALFTSDDALTIDGSDLATGRDVDRPRDLVCVPERWGAGAGVRAAVETGR